MKELLIGCIKSYKKHISPYFVRSCRYFPTCSEYAAEAIESYGVFRGTIMALWRILRCNPFSRGGVDPVRKKAE